MLILSMHARVCLHHVTGQGVSACADAAPDDLGFRVIARIPRRLECNLLVVTAQKLVLCQVTAAA